MKNIYLQSVVLFKYQKGCTPSKIFNYLNGSVGLRTVQLWCKMIKEKGAMNLCHSLGRPRTARTKTNIHKVKARLNRKKKMSLRTLAGEISTSKDSIYRILKSYLHCRTYNKMMEPLLTDGQKTKRIKFAYWV